MSSRTAPILAIVFAMLATVPAAAAPQPVPEGFSQFALLMQTGLYDLTEPHPELSGCTGGTVCEGQYFQEVIMGRSPAEILAEEEAAKDFFRQRYGLDVDDPINAGRLFFRSYMIDPRVEYRLYALGGAKVPSEGWEVRDGGHLLAVIDPAGIEFGGELAGTHAPAGTLLVFGNYNVLVTNPAGHPRGEIVIRYRCGRPINIAPDHSFSFSCDLEHPEWGEGLSHGMNVPVDLPDGRTHANSRTVLTFPGLAVEN